MKFWKMSGSGNDFVFVDGIGHPQDAAVAADPDFVRTVCAPHTGVGADGVAIFRPSEDADFALSYFNRDGSEGELCGNASLCAVRLSTELGIARQSGLRFSTLAGAIHGRIRGGRPEVDLQPVQALRADAGIDRLPEEQAMGFANTGVPHLVIRTEALADAPLATRGPELRYHRSLEAGANVNWVARRPGGWAMRTYERGVEAETLACGTGAVACAALLRAWGEVGEATALLTKSGQQLDVRFRDEDGLWYPTLAGEGRIVFEGQLREI
ncbi:MAG TPA: diaminopimelate epimerase [Gemmatimonadaceae bacterium]|nr:diaminopimelate epimerase [Gemmatimonadaceae bacterium]